MNNLTHGLDIKSFAFEISQLIWKLQSNGFPVIGKQV